jgi:hypothetical protein
MIMSVFELPTTAILKILLFGISSAPLFDVRGQPQEDFIPYLWGSFYLSAAPKSKEANEFRDMNQISGFGIVSQDLATGSDGLEFEYLSPLP